MLSGLFSHSSRLWKGKLCICCSLVESPVFPAKSSSNPSRKLPTLRKRLNSLHWAVRLHVCCWAQCQTCRHEQQRARRVVWGLQADVMVCAKGGGGLLKERMALVADLWAAGLRAEMMQQAAPSLTAQYEYAHARHIPCLLIIQGPTLSPADTVKVRPFASCSPSHPTPPHPTPPHPTPPHPLPSCTPLAGSSHLIRWQYCLIMVLSALPSPAQAATLQSSHYMGGHSCCVGTASQPSPVSTLVHYRGFH